MKLIPVLLIVGMLAVSGGAEEVPYSPELVRKAESGDALAQYNLGIAFYMGAGVGKDEKEAVKWYTKSAGQGNPQAQRNLGFCYYKGTGVAKDAKEAVKWYTKSADQGDLGGQLYLGSCYYEGAGVEKDEKKAVKLFTEPALSGHPMAQLYLGRCYDTGTGVEKDENAAVRWYTRSAEQGNVYGQNAVAWVLATSNDPAIRNGKEAVSWAQKSIQKLGEADSNAMDTLAAAYAEQGDFAAAVSTQEKAISTLKDLAKSKEFQTHLKSYQGKKPWRDNE
jgi:TPR repeat protein